jgi:hypothetical protein
MTHQTRLIAQIITKLFSGCKSIVALLFRTEIKIRFKVNWLGSEKYKLGYKKFQFSAIQYKDDCLKIQVYISAFSPIFTHMLKITMRVYALRKLKRDLTLVKP